MTIDDELLIELFKPTRKRNVGEKALIKKVVGTLDIKYTIEGLTHHWKYYHRDGFKKLTEPPYKELEKITPDIIVYLNKTREKIAIEVENDIKWDFGESLRQVKKYQDKFPDTVVIIPDSYQRFAPLYKNEGIRVFLWTGKRKWKCLRCETITLNESRIPPRCQNTECNNNSKSDFELVGLENADVNEY